MSATYETREERLRKALGAGEWLSQRQMQHAGGLRYGARLHDAHESASPLHYETKTDPEDESRFFYREAPKSRCDICSDPNRVRPSVIFAQLERENAELRAELRALKGGRQ